VAKTDAFTLQRSDLNGFLFADVGIEANGMTLSVLSTIARRGMDPWEEAGRLARLPQVAATDWLAGIIAALPASLWPLAEARTIAARLVTLLPARANGPAAAGIGRPKPATARSIGQWAIIFALVASVFAQLLLGVSGHRGASSDSAVAATTASRPAPPAALPGRTTGGGHPPN
jgi:hypothetical protein